jgi:acetyltransferase-like isoleucine patch superfamily enzyme
MFRKLLDGYVSRVKGEDYVVDKRIPTGYLVSEFRTRLFMKLRGKLRFWRSAHTPFVGKGSVLRCRRQMHFGPGVSIGEHAYLDAVSVEGIVFGDNVSVGKRTVIECTGNLRHLGKGLRVGNNVGLGSDNFYGCAGGIVVGDDTIVGNFVSFHAENHNSSQLDIPIRLQGVNHQGIRIGNNCWIGAKCTILDGAVIGNGCIIAAEALVLAGPYKENGIYGGVPARLLKTRVNNG